MMRAVEVYMVIAVTLMKTNLGLPKTCLHYCKFPPENSSISPKCDCSLQNVGRTPTATSKNITTLPSNNSGIYEYYDSVKQFVSKNTSLDEQTLHLLSINPFFKSKHNTFNGTKRDIISVVEPFAKQDNYDENISKSSEQYKTDTYFPKLMDETKELPLQLYLDIDITMDNDKRPQLEELKNMFENFQTAEKNLSECINLHIYIFSKYIDNINKTNWGRKVQHDNLSNFQQLTEIQSKCNQPASIIKQSIYQIKELLSREDKTAEITKDERDAVYTTDSYKDIRAQKVTTNVFGNVTVSDMYPDSLLNHPTDDNNNNDVTETDEIVARKMKNVQLPKKYSGRDGHNWFDNDLLDKKNTDITSTSSFYEDSTVYDKINLASSTDPTGYGSLGTTSKMNRIVFSEKDMTIPRIITKELSNGTVLSVVDGYENVPNSDFILTNQDHNIASTPSKNLTTSNPDLVKSNIDKIVPSDIVNIHGNLYFSFGEKQIPARFIQQSDGELDVAIDGFSMCDQILEHNTSNFMNSLCKCIIRKNCT